MSTIDDKRTQILLDFIVHVATYLIIINFSYMILSWLVEIIISLIDFWTNGQMAEIGEKVTGILGTLRVVVGISSVFISLFLTMHKLRASFAALQLPEATITSQDVPNINGFDPATKQRLENVLSTLIKVLTVAILTTVVLDVLHSVVTHADGILTSGSWPIIIIGLPTVIGLFILRLIIRAK